MTAAEQWPKPFKILCANAGSGGDERARCIDEFENMLTEWWNAGFHLYAGGFHPDDKVFWALMYRRMSEPKQTLTIEALMLRLQDHYWDSLAPHKDLILKHVRGALKEIPRADAEPTTSEGPRAADAVGRTAGLIPATGAMTSGDVVMKWFVARQQENEHDGETKGSSDEIPKAAKD